MSWDYFLGGPFNIASYAILTHMVAQVCNLEVGELLINGIDVHLYKNQIDQVKEQLSRNIFTPPTFTMDKTVASIDDFSMSSFSLTDYNYHPSLKAKMAV